MRRKVSRNMAPFFGNETMKELGIVLDFKSKTITIDEITLPMRNVNLPQGTSTIRSVLLS
jgi:hypothetical protein